MASVETDKHSGYVNQASPVDCAHHQTAISALLSCVKLYQISTKLHEHDTLS